MFGFLFGMFICHTSTVRPRVWVKRNGGSTDLLRAMIELIVWRLVGWQYLMTYKDGKVRRLRKVIADRDRELADYQRLKSQLIAKDGELDSSKVRHDVLGFGAGHAILPYVERGLCLCGWGDAKQRCG
jgi:hypothetical protein